jgi:hypothetical protein
VIGELGGNRLPKRALVVDDEQMCRLFSHLPARAVF